MMKQKLMPVMLTMMLGCSLFVLGGNGLVRAEEKLSPPPAKDDANKTELFSGKIEERNLEEKWLKIDKKTYLIGEKTRLLNKDKEIKLEDLTVGTEVNGLARKNAAGKLEATIVKVGLKPHEAPPQVDQ